MSVVEIIQSMLAPGIMISACGLLLLGMNNKYSLIVSRIRIIDEEKRKLMLNSKRENFSEMDNTRLNSINNQIYKLNKRLRHVRNVVVFYTIGIAFFILSSLSIGYSYIYEESNFSNVSLILFLIGMFSVLLGIIFACVEVIKGYKIIQIEIEDTDKFNSK